MKCAIYFLFALLLVVLLCPSSDAASIGHAAAAAEGEGEEVKEEPMKEHPLAKRNIVESMRSMMPNSAKAAFDLPYSFILAPVGLLTLGIDYMDSTKPAKN